MTTYIFVKNRDPWICAGIKNAYLRESFTVFDEKSDHILLIRRTDSVDEYTERVMLQCVLSRLCMTPGSFTVDLSDLMNRHIERLTENGCQSLKFHDLFLDELRQMQVCLTVSQ